jgi:hypothetical protein
MKTLYTLLILTVFAIGAKAQVVTPFTFEQGGRLINYDSDTLWWPFANGAEGSWAGFEIVENPYAEDPNLSDSVVQFVVQDDAVPWVGMYTDSVEIMEFTEDAHMISMMVLKTVVSPCGIKVERSINSGEDTNILVENTLTDEWELLTFDFSALIGKYYQRLTIFPDFPATREGGSTVYLDNIASSEINTKVKEFDGASLKLFPNPVGYRMSVQYPEMTGISVSDIMGKKVKSFSFQKVDAKVIEVGDLQTGTYFVTVETENGNYTASFIKK